MNKRLLIIGIAIVGLGLLIYAAYNYWTTTPQYALQQIAKGIETHDVELFHKYVDVHTVTGRLIEDVMNEASQTTGDGLGESLAKGLFELMKPRISEFVSEQVDKYVEKGEFTENAKNDGNEAPFSLRTLEDRLGKSFNEVKYVKVDGKIALVGIGLHNERLASDHVLELKLRQKEGGYWQVVELSNLASLMKEIGDLESAKLVELNKPTRTQMDLALTIQKIKRDQTMDHFGFDRKMNLYLTVKNQLEMPVKGFEATLVIRNRQSDSKKALKTLNLTFDGSIAPKETSVIAWEFKINQFKDEDMAVFKTPDERLDFEFLPRMVSLGDGTTLQLKTSLD